MKVSEAMTRNPEIVRLNDTARQAAVVMKKIDVGAVPVLDGDEPTGILTDRDIAVRLVAEGKDPSTTRVGDIMSKDIVFCSEDAEVGEAARIMSDKKIRRLIVKDGQGKSTGIVSLGDIAVSADKEKSGEAIREVSTPSEPAR